MEQAEPVPVLAGITKNEGLMIYGSSLTHTYTFGFDVSEEIQSGKRWVFILAQYISKDMSWLKDRDHFINFLEVNLRWHWETAEKHADTLRLRYFPNLSTLSSSEIGYRFVDVSDLKYQLFLTPPPPFLPTFLSSFVFSISFNLRILTNNINR